MNTHVYPDWDEWYRTTAREIASAVGGHPGEAEAWLRDGDADPDDSMAELQQEWREVGATYQP